MTIPKFTVDTRGLKKKTEMALKGVERMRADIERDVRIEVAETGDDPSVVLQRVLSRYDKITKEYMPN